MATLQLKLSGLNVTEFVTALEARGLSRTPSKNFLNHFYFKNDKFMVYYDNETLTYDIFISKPKRNKALDTCYACNKHRHAYSETSEGLYVQIGEMSSTTGVLDILHTREMANFERWLFN